MTMSAASRTTLMRASMGVNSLAQARQSRAEADAHVPLYPNSGRKSALLLPNAREKPPSDAGRIIRITRKLYLKNSVLHDSAIEQKRQTEDYNNRGGEPRSERGSACRYDQNPRGISGMADEDVGSGSDNVLAAVGLDAND